MKDQKVTILDEDSSLAVVKDARAVSLRWDLIPWCLTLDLDTPLDESYNSPLRRAWLIFVGISELSFSFEAQSSKDTRFKG